MLNVHVPPNTLQYPSTLPARLMADLGFDVHVVSRGPTDTGEVEGVPLWVESSHAALAQRIARLRPKLLFVESTSYGCFLRPLVHRIWVRNPPVSPTSSIRTGQRAALWAANAISFTNPEARRAWKFRPSQVADLPYPVDTTFWASPTKRDPSFWTSRSLSVPSGPVIAYVAGLQRVKRQPEALVALTGLLRTRPDLMLVFVGHAFESSVEQELKASRAALGIEKQVLLLGALPHADIKSLYAWTALTVTNSEHETQCMSVYESLAAGVPAVISAIPELMSQFPGLPAHADGVSLSAHVEELLANPRRGAMLVEDARPQVAWADRKRHDDVFAQTVERLVPRR
ncbi:MAG: hypothetical protein QOI95_3459 [Acidimicrobiaceae bacterium]